jgi:hypothetical protein
MIAKRTQSNENTPIQAEPVKVGLKVMISEGTRRKVRARADLDGVKIQEVAERAFMNYLAAAISDEEHLARILRSRLPHGLFVGVDALRNANRATWIETLAAALVQASQAPAPRPVLTVPRAQPRSTPPITTHVDVPWDPASESDSGVRQAANQ